MPADVRDIAKKAEVSHSTVSWVLNNHLVIAHEAVERLQRCAHSFRHVTVQFVRSLRNRRSRRLESLYGKTQGGIEKVAHSLIIENSLFTFVYRNKLGIYMSKVFIHRCVNEIFFHSFYYDVKFMSVETAFT